MRACTRPRSVCRLLLAAVIALSVSGCDEPEASSEHGGETAASGPQSLSDLVPSPDVSFEVVFRQYDSEGNASDFVWRQGNGRRRWDDVPITPEGLNTGAFSLEIDFSKGARLGEPSLGCGWSTRPTGPGEALVICSSLGWEYPQFAPVTAALGSYVTEELPAETILGRRASCYSLERPPAVGEFSRAVVCLDSTNGIPLRLEIEDRINYGLNVKMEAISVSLEDQDLIVPVELQPNPERPEFSDLKQFNGTVPLATLQLPDLTQFEE